MEEVREYLGYVQVFQRNGGQEAPVKERVKREGCGDGVGMEDREKEIWGGLGEEGLAI